MVDKNRNELTPAQTERLALLSEEMGEAIQAIGKILRHGYNSFHPDSPEICNRRDLEKELGHVRFAQELLVEADDITFRQIIRHRNDKRVSVVEYLHHQSDRIDLLDRTPKPEWREMMKPDRYRGYTKADSKYSLPSELKKGGICPGCSVIGVWEHRCYRKWKDHYSGIAYRCECQECGEEDMAEHPDEAEKSLNEAYEKGYLEGRIFENRKVLKIIAKIQDENKTKPEEPKPDGACTHCGGKGCDACDSRVLTDRRSTHPGYIFSAEPDRRKPKPEKEKCVCGKPGCKGHTKWEFKTDGSFAPKPDKEDLR